MNLNNYHIQAIRAAKVGHEDLIAWEHEKMLQLSVARPDSFLFMESSAVRDGEGSYYMEAQFFHNGKFRKLGRVVGADDFGADYLKGFEREVKMVSIFAPDLPKPTAANVPRPPRPEPGTKTGGKKNKKKP